MDEQNNLVSEGRGRNGFFMVNLGEVFVHDREAGPFMEIAVLSRRTGDSPPIKVQGNMEDVVKFFDSLNLAVKIAAEKSRKYGGSTIQYVNKKGEVNG